MTKQKTIATKTLPLNEQSSEIFDRNIESIKPDYLMFSLRFKVILKKFYGVKLTREEQKIFEQMEREYNGGQNERE